MQRQTYNPRDIPEANNNETRLVTHKLIADAWDLFSSETSCQYTDISLKIGVSEVSATPTVLHCLGFNLYHTATSDYN